MNIIFGMLFFTLTLFIIIFLINDGFCLYKIIKKTKFLKQKAKNELD